MTTPTARSLDVEGGLPHPRPAMQMTRMPAGLSAQTDREGRQWCVIVIEAVEAGLMLRDEGTARRAIAQFERLVAAGASRACSGS